MSPIEANLPNSNLTTTTTKSFSGRVKFRQILQNSSEEDTDHDNNGFQYSSSSSSSNTSSPRLSNSTNNSPRISSFDDIICSSSSPYLKSPWIKLSPLPNTTPSSQVNDNVYFSRGKKCFIGSLVREEGHVYSLAIKDGMLYTGSESRNIRVWRNFRDAGGFKSGSGLVKAIVVSKDDKIFTGHQDGKIRIWNPNGKRVGTLPKFGEFVKSSLNPKNYVEVRRNRMVPRIKHFDAVSCMGLDEEFGLLYSGSWDRSVKVWRVSDGKCMESFEAHGDAINSIVVGPDGLVFTGSADGMVKMWRREFDGWSVRHYLMKVLLKQKDAVTALAVAVAERAERGNGRWVLYAGSSEGLVNFWERDVEEGVVYGGVLRGHKLAVLCLATAGSLVLSGSADKTICVWRRENGGVHSCLSVLSGHLGPVKCLAIEHDHNSDDNDNVNDNNDDDDRQKVQQRDWIVYSGSLDKSVRVWRVSEHGFEDESTYMIHKYI